MNPFVSWGIVLTVAGAGYLYYNKGSLARTTSSRTTSTAGDSKAGPSKREARAKRKPGTSSVSELSANDDAASPATELETTAPAEGLRKRRGSKEKSSRGPSSPSITVRDSDADSDAAANSKFAENMLKAKEGTKLAPPAKNSGRTKTVKTSGLAGVSPSFSSASSTAGADADGEFSPAVSPSLQAAGDVSDMLEPTSPGPSILRLTEDPNKPAPRQKPAPKEFQVAETKKQRQNRQKNEDRKAANAAIEGERQKLLEQQRRTAREARGEPARNGLKQAKAPSSNAWTAKTAGSVETPQAALPVEPLLDTFDRSEPPAVGNAQVSIVPSVPPTTNGGHTTNGRSRAAEYANGLSEQDQLHLATKASEDESGWNEVPAKKGKTRPTGPVPQAGKGSGDSNPAVGNALQSATGRYAGLHVDD